MHAQNSHTNISQFLLNLTQNLGTKVNSRCSQLEFEPKHLPRIVPISLGPSLKCNVNQITIITGTFMIL